jgi:hypothetical protein
MKTYCKNCKREAARVNYFHPHNGSVWCKSILDADHSLGLSYAVMCDPYIEYHIKVRKNSNMWFVRVKHLNEIIYAAWCGSQTEALACGWDAAEQHNYDRQAFA